MGDAVMTAGYLGDDATAERVFTDVTERYTDLVERDHAAHDAVIASGAAGVADGL